MSNDTVPAKADNQQMMTYEQARLRYRGALMAAQKTVAAALPQGMEAVRLCAVFVACAEAAPDLYDCTPESIGTAFVKVAYAGLYPSPQGGRGEIWLIPRREHGVLKVSVQAGYKGLCTLAYRGGMLRTAAAKPVYATERLLDWMPGQGETPFGFYFQDEPSQVYHRRPLDFDETTAGIPIGAYAVAELQTGGRVAVYLPRSTLVKRALAGRTVNEDGKGWIKGGGHLPWIAHPGDMARKTALMDLLNGGTVPLSPDVSPLIAEIVKAERHEIEGSWEPAGSAHVPAPAQLPVNDVPEAPDIDEEIARLRAQELVQR